jgi:hypothetical protein
MKKKISSSRVMASPDPVPDADGSGCGWFQCGTKTLLAFNALLTHILI